MNENLYATLGVPFDADEAAIKLAFKRKAMQHHPDREGGNHEQMQQVQQAYDVLSSPERRARYDETGAVDIPDTVETLAGGLLSKVVLAVFEEMDKRQIDVAYADVIRALRNEMTAGVQQVREMQVNITKKIIRRRGALGRVVFGGEIDYVSGTLKQGLDGLENLMKENEKQIDIMTAVLDLLADYTYQVDEKPASQVEAEMFSSAFQRAMEQSFKFRFGS